MKWQGRRGSSNVEDRRGSRGGGGKLIGGGISGIIIVVIVTLLSGGNIGDIMGNLTSTGSSTGSNAPYEQTAQEKELSEFVSVVLADTEDVWSEVFQEQGKRTRILRWYSIAAAWTLPAEPPVRQSGRSIAPGTLSCISISASTTSCSSNSMRRAISPWLM